MATTQTDDEITTDDLVQFLKQYYKDEIAELAQRYPKEQQSLTVSFDDLYRYDHRLAVGTSSDGTDDGYIDNPDSIIEWIEEALASFDLPADIDLSDASVRVGDLTDEYVRSPGKASREALIGSATGVEGQITKATQAKPRVDEAAFECGRCGTVSYIPQIGDSLEGPHDCPGCEREGPFRFISQKSEWVDHQYLRIQEPPEKSGTGQGANMELHVRGDIIDAVEPGDRVVASGQIQAEQLEPGDDLDAETHLEVSDLTCEETSYDDIDVDEHIEEIRAIANGERGDPFGLWVDSIKPSHWGDDHIKLAITLQLMEGWRRGDERGSSHILLMGDPGCDKSGFLEFVDNLAPRSAYASGKGTTAAGLTAGAVSDDFGDTEWSLEAGAMVIADEGIACIDELDKIDEAVVSSLHGALESQKVRVNKVIKATLSCRTSLLAAGNPKYGRFDQYQPIGEQIEIPPTLMSRFDLMFMVSDHPNPERDRKIMEHKSAAARAAAKKELGEELTEKERDSIEPEIEPEVMRAYIAHAKSIKPLLPEGSVAEKLMHNEFMKIRLSNEEADDAPVPVTWRKQEAIRRLSEASARVRLSDVVETEDVQRALDLVKKSMQQVGVDPETDQFDADVIETGRSKTQHDRIKSVKATIVEKGPISAEEVAGILDIDQGKVKDEIEKLRSKGEIYDHKNNGEYVEIDH